MDSYDRSSYVQDLKMNHNHHNHQFAVEHTSNTNQTTPASGHLQLQAPFMPNTNRHSNTSHEQQQQQEQRQMALMNLFSSLSNLATNNQLNQQQQQQPLINNQPPISDQQQALQSVMAAAMMQQQQQQQQQSSKSTIAPMSGSLSTPNLFHTHKEPQININGQQRINYCTICNKELCNKYFMKTHMLKMHGINLEMETSQSGADDDSQNQLDDDQIDDQAQPEDCSSTSQQNTNYKRRKESQPAPANQTTTATTTTTSSAGKQTKQQPATSVMNGFAGNSMGGVICDICNKELCSKYFLKVHKQNTHGIATDNYQMDSSPFAAIYPFAAAAAAASSMALPFHQPSNVAASLAGSFDRHQPGEVQQHSSAELKLRTVKKIRLGQQQQQQQQQQAQNTIIESKASPTTTTTTAAAGQFESLYRLMLAQQPQPAADIDPVAVVMNPLSALMYFGAGQQAAGGHFLSPAATLSPAMIVDQILRNQHLFSQHQHQHQQHNKPANKTTADKNNNNSGVESHNTKQASSATKQASNKRYFSHYTEACPMCDRRFKSIKWLKTHMMNDHKHEIGAYMQSMMQYLYQTSKSQQQQQHQQQLAAAASMASFEQHQPLFHRQQYSAHLQGNQLVNVFNQQQQQQQLQLNLAANQAPPFVDHTAQQHYRTSSGENYVFDARCTNNNRRDQERRASLSPADSLSNHLHQQQQQQQQTIKRESSNSSSSTIINNLARSSLIVAVDEEHDLGDAQPAASSNSTPPPPQHFACELNFELADERNDTFPSPSSSSLSPSSPGPTFALDSRRQSSGTNSPATASAAARKGDQAAHE